MARVPKPALVEDRRRLAGTVLAAAAAHSAITDELHELEAVRSERPWNDDEAARHAALVDRQREARRRHDAADRQLRRLMSGAPPGPARG